MIRANKKKQLARVTIKARTYTYNETGCNKAV